MVEPLCSNLRVFIIQLVGVQKFRNFTLPRFCVLCELGNCEISFKNDSSVLVDNIFTCSSSTVII